MGVVRLSTLDARNEELARMFGSAAPEAVQAYNSLLTLSWIHHDSALEGVVLSFPELRAALDEGMISDVSLIPSYRDVQAHQRAIGVVRDLAAKRRTPITVELVKRMYCALTPEETDPRTLRFREEMPLHRLYFHEIAPTKKIEGRFVKLVEWINDPSTKAAIHPIRLAARAHLKMLQIYPYTKNSGKLARLLMNLLLMRSDYHPAIIHSTERQVYYESLRASSHALTNIVMESLDNSMESALRFLGEYARVARSA
ncbi:MAG: Fic family protein [Deltaproteobacteria bacterium]|nr:Fic family protein [Deltaproteobacteria bacterium]